jgi:hypothetical protein
MGGDKRTLGWFVATCALWTIACIAGALIG